MAIIGNIPYFQTNPYSASAFQFISFFWVWTARQRVLTWSLEFREASGNLVSRCMFCWTWRPKLRFFHQQSRRTGWSERNWPDLTAFERGFNVRFVTILLTLGRSSSLLELQILWFIALAFRKVCEKKTSRERADFSKGWTWSLWKFVGRFLGNL